MYGFHGRPGMGRRFYRHHIHFHPMCYHFPFFGIGIFSFFCWMFRGFIWLMIVSLLFGLFFMF